MTPQEKAKELFGKFAMYLRANLMYDEEADEDAKQCALKTLDEILFALKYDINEPTSGSIKYWLEVKQEIEKL